MCACVRGGQYALTPLAPLTPRALPTPPHLLAGGAGVDEHRPAAAAHDRRAAEADGVGGGGRAGHHGGPAGAPALRGAALAARGRPRRFHRQPRGERERGGRRGATFTSPCGERRPRPRHESGAGAGPGPGAGAGARAAPPARGRHGGAAGQGRQPPRAPAHGRQRRPRPRTRVRQRHGQVRPTTYTCICAVAGGFEVWGRQTH